MIAGMYFLWQELGVACLAGLLALLLLMPVQAFFSHKFGSIRTNTVNARDERIRTLSDVFSGIDLDHFFPVWELANTAEGSVRLKDTIDLYFGLNPVNTQSFLLKFLQMTVEGEGSEDWILKEKKRQDEGRQCCRAPLQA
jgi:hypothetical protein